MRLVVISGHSGSGKTSALNVLEDIGFTCIDNLPASLLHKLINDVHEKTASDDQNVAIGIDARNLVGDLSGIPEILQTIQLSGIDVTVIFMCANHADLVRRFSETRRKHPLTSDHINLMQAIDLEEDLLAPIALITDRKVDTTGLPLHDLRDLIKNIVSPNRLGHLSILFESFGYKAGTPQDADFIFDVRCLANPYWKTELRKQSGLDKDVIKFLETQSEAVELLSEIQAFLTRWIPRFEANNRSYLTIAIGCTGGQHRSVFIASKLHQHFADCYPNVQLRHKQLVSANTRLIP